MKIYDYKDETKDVKGKVGTYKLIFLDRETQCYLRALADAPGPEKCFLSDYSQLGRGHAND